MFKHRVMQLEWKLRPIHSQRPPTVSYCLLLILARTWPCNSPWVSMQSAPFPPVHPGLQFTDLGNG